MPFRRAFAVAFGLFAPISTFAHHGPGSYDSSSDVQIEGTISNVQWRNPHLYLTVEAKDSNGQPKMRQIEAASVSTVQAFGLKRAMLPPGTHVIVVAHARSSRSSISTCKSTRPGSSDLCKATPLVGGKERRWWSIPQTSSRFLPTGNPNTWSSVSRSQTTVVTFDTSSYGKIQNPSRRLFPTACCGARTRSWSLPV